MNRAVNGPCASEEDEVADAKLEACLWEACTDEHGCMHFVPSTRWGGKHSTIQYLLALHDALHR